MDLYDLSTSRWTVKALEPRVCGQSSYCILDGVGTTWLRFFVIESGCAANCSMPAYLQSIRTGAVRPDPANNSHRQDSLDAPSGVGHPCTRLGSSALSLPYLDSFRLPLVPYWVQLGRFVLTTGVVFEIGATPDRLEACGSRISRTLPRYLVASARLVLWPKDGNTGSGPLRGLYLPELRPFVIPNPKGTPTALSGGILYDITRDSTLWAATITRS